METHPHINANGEKRTRFYVGTEIWEHDLSATAFRAYIYLCYCMNRAGRCYPSVREIARQCRLGESTVRRAIHELTAAGLVSVQQQYQPTKNGLHRQTVNTYILRTTPPNAPVQSPAFAAASRPAPTPPADSEPLPTAVPPAATTARPLPPRQGTPPDFDGEIYDKQAKISKLSPIPPSAGAQEAHAAKEREARDDAQEILFLIESLDLELYEDKRFAELIALTIQDMYYAESIRVGGEHIGRAQVRARLRLLDIDCIDHVQAQLLDRGESLQNIRAYLIACLYRAPIDVRLPAAVLARSSGRA